MNTPNKLTLFRIIMVIPFISILTYTTWAKYNDADIYKWLLVSAAVIFAVAMITDFIDGYLARKNNQVTTFGELFDPLADKFITTTSLVFLSVLGIVPVYISLLFILRDLLVDGSRNIAAKNNVKVSASFIGKAKTMLMSIGIILILLAMPFLDWKTDFVNPSWQVWALISPIIFAVILSTISGYKYIKAIKQYINTK